ncbi:MAG: hypothetical protein DME17_08460 [Candidatus Rokuibacteriota bacterium]|nr:MAG: hypothetical protein DME17_08460 [Candidatus Rokubacteria bacterium]
MKMLRALLAFGVLLTVTLSLANVPQAAAASANGAPSKCDSITGAYAFRLVSLKSFSAESPVASGLATAPYQDILRVGILAIDENCALTATVRATVDDNTGTTRLVIFTWTGVAFPAGDLGELRVRPGRPACFDSTLFTFSGGKPPTGCPAAVEGDEEYAYVVVHGHGLDLIQSDNAGGGAKIFMTGRAEKRVPGQND